MFVSSKKSDNRRKRANHLNSNTLSRSQVVVLQLSARLDKQALLESICSGPAREVYRRPVFLPLVDNRCPSTARFYSMEIPD